MRAAPARLPQMLGGLVVLLLHAPCAAQVLIVDEAGGPAAQFTDLPEAVAAAPDGATLRVQNGTYSYFTVAGKGLSIVGEDPGRVVLGRGNPVLAITATGLLQKVLIKDVVLSGLTGAPSVSIINTQGPVVLDGVSDLSVFPGRVQVVGGANVQLHRCDFENALAANAVPRIDAVDSTLFISSTSVSGGPGRDVSTGGATGSSALRLLRSRCIAYQSTMVAGRGGSGCAIIGGLCAPSGEGGVGVVVMDGSAFTALGTAVIGGEGREGFRPPFGGSFVEPTDGGDGIQATGGSIVDVRGTAPVGGAGGVGANPGQPFTAEMGSMVAIDPAAVPSSANVEGAMVVGATLQLTLDAAPGSSAVLVVGAVGQLAPLEPIVPGALLVPFEFAVPTPVVPASGRLQVPFVVPASWPLGATTFVQFATVDPATVTIFTTNAVAVHVNH